ncbi:hypothetical protein NIES4071_94120 [Calothrix sp. NIES-4071]|nr:hypothetical protein NIES4071_94120 [Calothrix sp. NIES-4071]BAZ63677.1 hypothetical protein NIES4105_94050 [Calothrix sp. NIES-4105]
MFIYLWHHAPNAYGGLDVKKRDDTVQKFSTFLSFQGVNTHLNLIWQTDLQLERHIKRLVQTSSEVSPEYWAHYFVKIVKLYEESGQQLSPDCFNKATAHLSSYLQETCLWAAHKTLQRFSFIRHKYPLDELFQIANLAINPPSRLFKSFDIEHPQANLNAYAKTAILRFTSNFIYTQDIEAKREKFSDYGLLKDLTAKELKEALFARGINSIDCYYLAWQCFDEMHQPVYNPTSRAFNLPSLQLERITSYYNQRCHEFKLASQSTAQIQEILSTCISCARDYRTKKFTSLNDYDITDYNPTLLETLIQHEEWQETQLIIKELFLALPEQAQLMLKLWHGLSLTQNEIAGAITSKYPDIKKQYQVARYLGKCTRNLLNSLIYHWQMHSTEVKVDDYNVEVIKDAMNDCLEVYTQQEFFDTLDRVAQTNIIDSISYSLIENDNTIKQNLISALKAEIETSMHLDVNALDAVENKLAILFDNWLINRNNYL